MAAAASSEKIMALTKVGVCSLKTMHDAGKEKKDIINCVASFMTATVFSTYYDEAKKLRSHLSAIKYDLDVMMAPGNPNTTCVVKNLGLGVGLGL